MPCNLLGQNLTICSWLVAVGQSYGVAGIFSFAQVCVTGKKCFWGPFIFYVSIIFRFSDCIRIQYLVSEEKIFITLYTSVFFQKKNYLWHQTTSIKLTILWILKFLCHPIWISKTSLKKDYQNPLKNEQNVANSKFLQHGTFLSWNVLWKGKIAL